MNKKSSPDNELETQQLRKQIIDLESKIAQTGETADKYQKQMLILLQNNLSLQRQRLAQLTGQKSPLTREYFAYQQGSIDRNK